MGSTGRGSTGRRRAMGLGFTIVAGVLTMASVALACTAYQGKLTVTNAQGQSRSADGEGLHGYCTGPLSTTSYTRAAPMSLGGTFTVTVGQTTECKLQNQLRTGGDYEVRWLDVDGLPATANCNAELTYKTTPLGTINLPATNIISDLSPPSTSKPFTAPTGSTGEINICVDLPGDTGSDSAPEIWLNVI